MKIFDLLVALHISSERDVYIMMNDPETNIPRYYDIELDHMDAQYNDDGLDDDIVPASVVLIPKETITND